MDLASEYRWIRFGGIISYYLILILQIVVLGYLDISLKEGMIGYNIAISSSFNLNLVTIILIAASPIFISYLIVLGRVRKQTNTVEIFGPNSLLNNVNMEKVRVLNEGGEFTEFHLKSYLSSLAEDEPIGTYDNLEMLLRTGLLVNQVLHSTNARTVKRVFVAEDNMPNAYTFRVIPIPFLGSDWIVINRSLIDLLEDEELKSVLVHEVGHVKARDSWVSLFYYVPRLVTIFVLAILLTRMVSPLLSSEFNLISMADSLILVSVIIIYQLFVRFTYRITRYTYFISELRADIFAINNINPIHLVNAIYKIYQKSLVYKVIQNELLYYKEKYPIFSSINENVVVLPDLQSGENSCTYTMMLVHGRMQNLLSMNDLQVLDSLELDKLITERLEPYEILGPVPPSDLRERVEFERSLTITWNDFQQMIEQMNRNPEINKDTTPTFLDRYQLISDLIKENENLVKKGDLDVAV